MSRAHGIATLLAALLMVSLLATAEESSWSVENCNGDGLVLETIELADPIVLMSDCAFGTRQAEDRGVLEIQSVPLDASLGWYISFLFDGEDLDGAFHVDLLDSSDAVIGTMIIDSTGCRFLPVDQEPPTPSQRYSREWVNQSWWLGTEHRFELRYHVPGEISVRFDWNYLAFSFVGIPLKGDAFSCRIRAQSNDSGVDRAVVSLELNELVIREADARGAW